MFVDFFIRRPVFATVCALLTVLGGAVSIPTLPIALFPNLAPPQVNVTSVYVGASSDVVENAVTTTIEQQVNGAEGMQYMTSSSGNDGSSVITATFDLDRDSDLATVDVQNRVNTALARLPQEVKATGVTVAKTSTALVLVASFYSPSGQYNNVFISNYVDVYLRDALRRIRGVADVRIFGERRYSMRLWLDPTRLAGRGVSASDVLRVIREQNAEIAAGQIGQAPAPKGQSFQISVRAIGRLTSPDEFGNLIVKAGADGSLVKIKDVGTVELGAEDYTGELRYNGHSAVGVGVFQLPDANALDLDREVRAELERAAKQFPPGLKYTVAVDTTTIIGESINEVLTTLVEAIVLVILVIFLFLQSWRSTVIPAITIPVSLVGTFIFVKAFGFSINTLTLFGLTLATGLVVDDAIVVIENIERRMHADRTDARTASSTGMSEVTGAVIATSLVLVAVFVPIALFPGTTGRLYMQFALTIAFSVSISAFNALTLTPALSALWLRRSEKPPWRFFVWINRGIDGLTNGYRHALAWTMRHKWLPLIVFAGGLALTGFMYKLVPSAFVPDEDQGYFIINVQAPEGVSLEYTSNVARQVEAILQKQPEIEGVFSVVGYSVSGTSPAKALLYIEMKPLEERKGEAHSAGAIIANLRAPLGKITEAIVVPFMPPAIRGIGSFGGFQFELQDRSRGTPEALADAAKQVIGQGSARPDLRGLFTGFSVDAPQLRVEIDRDRAKSLGVALSDIADALQVYLGSVYVNDFDFNQRAYRVYAQAAAPFRAYPADIGRLYVRSLAGAMIPLENLVRVQATTAPPNIYHYNMFRSVEINGAAAPGYSSGQAIRAMEEVSNKVLPAGMTYSWTGLALEELEAGGKTLVIFGLGVLVVFLVLCAQYESFTLPFIILLSVPLAILGALVGQYARGLQNDVYCQIGLVMLVGLAAKNAILIVEFAEQLRGRGASVVDAAIEAARLRLRPILMTSLAFILGVLPLVFASGAGSASRHSLGTTVCGGMLVSTFLNLFIVPVLYVIVEGLRLRSEAHANHIQ